MDFDNKDCVLTSSTGHKATLTKKEVFPVERPDGNISAIGTLFFSFFFQFSIFFPINIQHFSHTKKIAAARVAIISATRWTGNKYFVNAGLTPTL